MCMCMDGSIDALHDLVKANEGRLGSISNVCRTLVPLVQKKENDYPAARKKITGDYGGVFNFKANIVDTKAIAKLKDTLIRLPFTSVVEKSQLLKINADDATGNGRYVSVVDMYVMGRVSKLLAD